MKLLPLHGLNGKGKFVMVDDDTFEKYKKFPLKLRGKYPVFKRAGKFVYLHVDIMQPVPEGLVVDHENGDTLNAQRYNLTPKTQLANLKNQHHNRSKK